MKSAETCSCSLCNKFYTYLYHHIVVLDKYIHSNLVYYKDSEDDEPYDYGESLWRPKRRGNDNIKLDSYNTTNEKNYFLKFIFGIGLYMTYTYCCVYSARFLMIDRKPVRNMYSRFPKINLRNQYLSLVLL